MNTSISTREERTHLLNRWLSGAVDSPRWYADDGRALNLSDFQFWPQEIQTAEAAFFKEIDAAYDTRKALAEERLSVWKTRAATAHALLDAEGWSAAAHRAFIAAQNSLEGGFGNYVPDEWRALSNAASASMIAEHQQRVDQALAAALVTLSVDDVAYLGAVIDDATWTCGVRGEEAVAAISAAIESKRKELETPKTPAE